MSNNNKLKILLFGRVGDDIDAFVAKCKTLQSSKAGPFDAAFCVGSCNVQVLLERYGNGKNDDGSLPMRVYIQDPLQDVESLIAQVGNDKAKKDEKDQSAAADDSEEAYPCVRLSESIYILRNPTAPFEPSVWSLSVSDNVKKPELVVAVCPSHWRMDEGQARGSGMQKNVAADSSSSSSSSSLLAKLNHVSYTGCDMLLTTEWPQGVEQTLEEEDAVAASTSRVLSFDVAQIALLARARYHVAVSSNNGIGFVQSHPFAHLSATTNTVTCQHTGRFLALGSVVNAAAWKQVTDKKKAKFVHALGLQPLHTQSAVELQGQRPAQLRSCPYTDASYYMDGNEGTTGADAMTANMRSISGLSEAQARRILAEEQSRQSGGGGHRFGDQQRRRRDKDDEPETIDPTNLTLFVHGLHKDVTGILQSARGDGVLLKAFARFGATAIRKPPGADTSSFCFVDFPSHEKALACWTDLGGAYTVTGVDLTVKWATHKRKGPPGGGGDGDHHQQHPNKRRRLTEAEARDSSIVYFSMGASFFKSDEADPSPDNAAGGGGKSLETASERLRVWMEETLEEALAGGVPSEDRVKAADEPALQVQKRLPTETDESNFGFLEFASHAAASMALATITGSTDGGVVLPDALAMPAKEFEHVRLHWAHSKAHVKEKEFVEDAETGFRFERKHFPADSRKDCWFCLASESCEKHLITGVYDQCYSAMPKGPIHEGHILLVPVQHTSQGALKDAKLSDEMDKIKAGLREHTSQEYDMDLFCFERAIQTKGGYHTHVQCIPVPRQRGAELRATMVAQGRKADADIRELTSDLGLAAVLGDDGEDGYFYAEIPVSASESRRFLYKATGNSSLPLQFGREVVAAVLRKPNLAHWKSCVVDKEKESQMATKLRETLAKYIH